MNFAFVILLVWATIPPLCAALLPNQPTEYATRFSVPDPFLAYSFRQSSCVQGFADSDVGDPLTLVREPSASSCPTRTSANVFQNAITGFSVSQTGVRDALKSGSINSAFSSLTFNPAQSGTKSMSIEVWFSFEDAPVSEVEYTLVEIGSETGTSNTFNNAENQLRISYTKNNGSTEDIVRVRFAFNTTFNNDITSGEAAIPSGGVDLEAIGNSPKGTIFMLVVTIAGNNMVTVHAASLGATEAGEDSALSATSSRHVNNFVFPSTAVLRVGCTRSIVAPPSARTGFPGSIHFLAFYGYLLDNNQVDIILQAGLPNSLPAVRSAAVFLEEDQSKVVNLNQTGTLVFDMDGDPITRFRIRSTPPSGLRYNNQPIPGTDFEVTNSNQLTFIHSLQPNEFSVAETTNECVIPLANVTFDASDGLCDREDSDPDGPNCNSPKVAIARICVKDTQDLPTSGDVVVSGIRAGGSEYFELVPADLDDFHKGKSDNVSSTFRSRDTVDTYALGTAVKFSQTSNETYGDIVFFNGTDCNETIVPAGEFVSFVEVQQSPLKHAFKLCFKSKQTAPIGGSTTFSFVFRDRAGGEQLTPALVTFKIVNPVAACVGTPNQNPANIPCQSNGTEGSLIPIYLVGRDEIGRTLRFHLTSLPTHGTLYKIVGQTHNPTAENKGELAEINEDITPETVFPSLVYEPKPYYFNRVSYDNGATFVYKNKENQGLDGCIAFGSCRCPITTGIGCPDTFKYKVFAGLVASSEEGVYNVLVNGVASEFLPYVAPEKFLFSPPAQFHFTGNSSVRIVDPDDSTYAISVNFNANPGRIGWTSTVAEEEGFNFVNGENSCVENGCSEAFEVYASTAKINKALSTMFFSHASSLAVNSTARINVYKPRPLGTTETNKFNAKDNAFSQRISMIIESSGTGKDASVSGLDIAIYAGAGAVGFLALVCCCSACIWFARKTRQTAKFVRKSIASKRSQSIRQSHKYQQGMDEEEMSHDSRKSKDGGLLCCCCFNFKDDDERERPDTAALAHQRQSMASHRSSHLSTKSLARERQSQTMVAYQQPQQTSEPPPRGREGVAPSLDGQELQVADDSVFAWEKHIDRRTGDVYFFNPRTGVSQWDPPTIKVKRTGK